MLLELDQIKSTMVASEEQLQRFQKWSGVVTSLCQALHSLMEGLQNCADVSWQLKKVGARGRLDRATAPGQLEGATDHILAPGHLDGKKTSTPLDEAKADSLHPAVTASLLRRLRDLYQLTLQWMMQQGLKQRRCSEERALKNCTIPQLAVHPSASVYPVQMNRLPRQLTTATSEPTDASSVPSLKTGSGVTNNTGRESLSTRPCLPVRHCAESASVAKVAMAPDSSQEQRNSLQASHSTPPKRPLTGQSVPVKSPLYSQDRVCGTASSKLPKAATIQPLNEKILTSFKAVPGAVTAKGHQAEMHQVELAPEGNRDDSSVCDSSDLNSLVVPLESASLDLLQAVDWTYLDQYSVIKLQRALTVKRREASGGEEGSEREADGRGSAALAASCNRGSPEEQNDGKADEFMSQVQFQLNRMQCRRIRTYVRELTYPEAQELTGEVVVAVDVLDNAIPCDLTLHTISGLTSVAVKKSKAAVASLKALAESRRSMLRQSKEAASRQFSSQLQKRGPLMESVPVGKKCGGEAHEVDGLTVPAPFSGEEGKGDNCVAAKTNLSRRQRKRLNRKWRKTAEAEAATKKDQGIPFCLIATHLSVSH